MHTTRLCPLPPCCCRQVRGELYLRAEELKKQNKPIIYTNGERQAHNDAIQRTQRTRLTRAPAPACLPAPPHPVGNPQALGARPLTFVRQVVALVAAPFLLDDPATPGLFPDDAIARARALLSAFGAGGVGGYTDSRGLPAIRAEVAAFIAARDGVAAPSPEVGGSEAGRARQQHRQHQHQQHAAAAAGA